MNSTVAVIVCAHLSERAQQLTEAVASLRLQSREPDEIVVVVDGNAQLASYVRDTVKGITLVELPGRAGLAVARNEGVRSCSSHVILFLDDDALADALWVELLAAAVEEPGVLGASGASLPLWDAQRPVWLADEFLWTLGCSYAGQPVRRARVRNVYGGCCGLRRELFTELGGYDRRLGRSEASAGGGEEAELCLRAQERWPDCAFVYEPLAQIRHHVPASRLTMKYVLRRAFDEGRMKATVAWLHRGGLSPEVRFAYRLPMAIVRDLGCLGRGQVRGVARACGSLLVGSAVVLGLVVGRRSRIDQIPEVTTPANVNELERVAAT